MPGWKDGLASLPAERMIESAQREVKYVIVQEPRAALPAGVAGDEHVFGAQVMLAEREGVTRGVTARR